MFLFTNYFYSWEEETFFLKYEKAFLDNITV